MPAVPSCILSTRCARSSSPGSPRHGVAHPLGCHRPRIADAVVFDKLVQALVPGCGYERLADGALLGDHAAPPPG